MCYVYDMGLFKVVFYVKSCFVKDLKLRYKDGEMYVFIGQQDPDFLFFFEACDFIKGMD